MVVLLHVSLLLVGYDGYLESESLLLSDGTVKNGMAGGLFKTTSANVDERADDRFGNFIQLLI